MSFQTPPTFYDGDVLSASQLNILASNQNELTGGLATVNLGFPETVLSPDESRFFRVVHSFNNLYVYFVLPSNGSTLRIYYESTLVFALYEGNAGVHIRNVDLSSFGLTIGVAYRVKVVADDNHETSVLYMCESESAI